MLLSVPPTTNQDFAKVKATSLCCTKFIHSTFQSQSHSQRHVDSTYRVTVKDRVIWLHRGRWWATIQLRSCRIDRNPEIIVSKVKAAALENATHKSVYKFVLERCILFFVCASNRNMWECAYAWQIDWRIHIKKRKLNICSRSATAAEAHSWHKDKASSCTSSKGELLLPGISCETLFVAGIVTNQQTWICEICVGNYSAAVRQLRIIS